MDNKLFNSIACTIGIFIFIMMIALFCDFFQKDLSVRQKEHSTKFGAVYMTLNNPFYTIINEEMRTQIESHGDVLLSRNPHLDEEEQSKEIQELVEQGIKVLFINPIDSGNIAGALENGVEPISDENKNHYFIDDKVEDAIRFVKAINNLNNGYGVSPRDFDLGKVAFRPFTFAEYRTYQPYPWRIKKYSGFEWDVVKFPAGHYGKNVSTVDTVAMAISSRSKNKTIAWKFLKKISYDKGIQMSIIEKSQGLPVRNDILTSAECQERFDKVMGYGNHMSLSVIDDIMSEAVHANKFRRYWDVMLQADKFIKEIVEGNITVDNSLNQLQKEINIKIEE